MQQPHCEHTQPSPVQFTPQPIHQLQPQMMMCPVQFVYDPQVLMPDEQVQSPTQPFQNQAYLLNVQNTPPWIQNRTNMVYMPQVQMTSNMQPYIPQNMVQNPMFSYQYQPMIVQEHIRPMYMNQVVQTPQAMVQNPQMMVQTPQTMVQNPQVMVQNPQAMVQNPQVMVQNPQAMIQNAQTMVQNAQTMVQNPPATIQNPQANVQNPQIMVQTSQAIVQTPQTIVQTPQAMVQTPQTIVKNPQTIVQTPQTIVKNSQTMAQSTQTIGKNPQTMVQNTQTIVQNQQNNTQHKSQNQLRIPNEQTRELPILTQMLQNHTRKAANTPEMTSTIQVMRPQYQNARQQLIIVNSANHTCGLKEPPVSNEQNDLPQHIKSQIPEGLSVKTIFKVPAAMVKPNEYVLQNMASPSNAYSRSANQTMTSYRDLQTNKRKIGQNTEQNVRDESEAQTVKRSKKETNTQNSNVNVYINIPTEIVDLPGDRAKVKNWRPPNTVKAPDMPRKEDNMLRNTVYVQARGRVNETQNHQQGYVRIAPAISDGRIEKNTALVPDTNNRNQEDTVTVTENSKTDEIKPQKTVSNSFLTLSTLLKEAEEATIVNNSKSMPSLLPDNVNSKTNKKKPKIAPDTLTDIAKGKARISKITQILSNINDNVMKKPKKLTKEEKRRKAEIKKMVIAKDRMEPPIEKYILTHVLDGHIIQESNVPFVVQKTISPIKVIPNRIEDMTTPSSNNKENESSNNIEKVEKPSSNVETNVVHSNNTLENEKSSNIKENGVTKEQETDKEKPKENAKRDEQRETVTLTDLPIDAVKRDINSEVTMQPDTSSDKGTIERDKESKNAMQLVTPEDIGIIKRDKEREIAMQPDSPSIISGLAERDEEREPVNEEISTNIKKTVESDEEREMVAELQIKDSKETLESDKEREETTPTNINKTAKIDEERETAVETAKDTPDIDNARVINEDDPFERLSRDTVAGWTVDDVFLHLMEYENWRETAQKLSEEEIDGESLLLVNKDQLLRIGICEEHAEVLSDFLEKVE